MSSRILLILTYFAFQYANAIAQQKGSSSSEKELYLSCIAFYNVENLFDTIDTPGKDDAEYLPGAPIQWNTQKYNAKLNKLSEVISQLGTEAVPTGPAVVGLCEVETQGVVEDLAKNEKLKKNNYQVVFHDGPDRRGVDVALMYNSELFTVTNSKSYTLRLASDTSFRTRDQLVVSGKLQGEEMHFIVCHWPSRRGGEKKSRPLRIEAAKLARHIIDSLLKIDANARIILMGDLNDDPINASVKKTIGTTADPQQASTQKFYNAMEDLYKKGIGTLAYRDNWNLFDQMILSPGIAKGGKDTWGFYKAKVFNRDFVKQSDGNFKGYPWRTYVGGTYYGGYSDHFAVYVFLVKEKK
jgi:hypothetical protein